VLNVLSHGGIVWRHKDCGATGRECESSTVWCERSTVRFDGAKVWRDLRLSRLRTGPSHRRTVVPSHRTNKIG